MNHWASNFLVKVLLFACGAAMQRKSHFLKGTEAQDSFLLIPCYPINLNFDGFARTIAKLGSNSVFLLEKAMDW